MRTKDFDEEEALEKALQLFWHKGYNGTSMQDVLDTLGLSRSSLYRTFIDKHTLYIRALAKYQQFSSEEIRRVMNDGLPVKDNIRKLLEFIADVVISDAQQKGCFMLNSEVEVAPHDKEIHCIVLNNDQEMEEVFFQLAKKGQDNGELTKAKDARAIARFLLNTAKGIRVTVKSTSDRAIFSDVIEMALFNL
jgi:TetR/AcrR family transcriptional repressor of nem operon